MSAETFTIHLKGARTYTFTYPSDFIGVGSMANLYRGKSHDGQSVAIKALKPENEKSPVTLNLWKNNADFKLKHKNLMQVYEEIYQNERRHIVLEFITGNNYESVFSKLSEKEHLLVLEQVLEGLHGLHENQYVHRDIKPSNILVDLNDKHFTKIIDYDLVMHKDTRMNHFVGTLQYSPAESIKAESIDNRCDLWAVGVMLYRVYNNGQLPFNASTKEEMLKVQASKEYKHGNYPANVQRIIDKALDPDINNRYKSAAEMLRVIQGIHQKSAFDNIGQLFSGDELFSKSAKIAISATFILLLTTLLVLLKT
jgi:serine/threonine protein kinase